MTSRTGGFGRRAHAFVLASLIAFGGVAEVVGAHGCPHEADGSRAGRPGPRPAAAGASATAAHDHHAAGDHDPAGRGAPCCCIGLGLCGGAAPALPPRAGIRIATAGTERAPDTPSDPAFSPTRDPHFQPPATGPPHA